MDKLCERLIETYNTTVLDDVDKVTQAAFYSEAKKHRGKGKGLTTLMDLIYKHYQGKKPKPKFIGGPRTLTLHWSDKYQKMIYIFGEYHSRSTDCTKFPSLKAQGLNVDQPQGEMTIESFLEDLITNTDAFIDMYFEFPAYTDGKYINPNLLARGYRMERLLHHFETCLQYARRAASKCQLVRIHYFDVRKEEGEGIHDVAWFRRKLQRLFSAVDKKKQLKDILKDDPRIKKVLNGLNSHTIKTFDKFWEHQLKENPYVKKEVAKSPLKDKIIAFITKEIKKEAMLHRAMWRKEIPKIFKPKNDDEFVDSFRQVYDATVAPNARIPDAYTLARIFKDFDTTKHVFKGGSWDQPKQAHNIIIYAGDSHSRTYRKFLNKELGFKELAKTEVDRGVYNCLNMSKFPQPFFSHFPENKGFLAKLFGWN